MVAVDRVALHDRTDRRLHEARFRAMGTDVHIGIVTTSRAPADLAVNLLQLGMDRIHGLEQCWSRFIESSELSVLNRSNGRPTIVSADTYHLVELAIEAWQRTGGLFDPTVGPTLERWGYDGDFAEVRERAPVDVGSGTSGDAPAPGMAGVDLVGAIRSVTLPTGVTIDPGGIGKGLAADMTAMMLMDMGASGVLVNVGGDMRAVGQAADEEGWVVTVPDPQDQTRELLRLAMADGAIATSSRLLRHWRTTAGEAHHLIDPRVGRPAQGPVVAVTAVTSVAWWAEALTKTLLLRGPDAIDSLDGAHAVAVLADGTRRSTSGLRGTLR